MYIYVIYTFSHTCHTQKLANLQNRISGCKKFPTSLSQLNSAMGGIIRQIIHITWCNVILSCSKLFV